jgi:hypothetical protein
LWFKLIFSNLLERIKPKAMKKFPKLALVLATFGMLFSSIAEAQSLTNREGGYNPIQSLNFLAVKQTSPTYRAGYLPQKFSLPEFNQDTTLVYQIITRDGNEFIGTIIEQDAQKIIMQTEALGVITIQKLNIKNIKLIDGGKVRDGAYWEDHMQSTRHFWSPNGYGLKKGEAYYQNVWIFFNQISVGVTDNILLGGGMIPAFLIAGSPTPVWFTPKVSFPLVKNKINVGGGGLFATVLGEPDTNFGIVYGTTTFGPRDKNVTLGVGYGYGNSTWATQPTFTLSYISRVGRKGYFISENYLINIDGDYLFLGMIGGRSMLGKGNVGLDYGLVVPIAKYMDNFVAIPWLGITVPFGQNN